MKIPGFWKRKTMLATCLSPLGQIYGLVTKYRFRFTKPYSAQIPVVCVGNLTAGGTGKTPVCLALAELLRKEGYTPFFLSRGYGGTYQGKVDPLHHNAAQTGDEALLLAAAESCWVFRDRAQGARAIEQAAKAVQKPVIIMDDGFQNPTLHKDFSFLVIDGAYGFGNECLIPAGPLRENPQDGFARADAIILLGETERSFPLPVLKAKLVPKYPLKTKKVFAFAGIGRPEKFYQALKGQGADLTGYQSFPDHYAYNKKDIANLQKQAAKKSATLITTEKDFVRLPNHLREGISVLSAQVIWHAPQDVLTILNKL